MTQINIVFPHQLFAQSALLEQPGDFYLIEEYLYFKQYNFHKQKLRYHRASMQFYKDYLIQSNELVVPLEVKAGTSKHIKSLFAFLKYNPL